MCHRKQSLNHTNNKIKSEIYILWHGPKSESKVTEPQCMSLISSHILIIPLVDEYTKKIVKFERNFILFGFKGSWHDRYNSWEFKTLYSKIFKYVKGLHAIKLFYNKMFCWNEYQVSFIKFKNLFDETSVLEWIIRCFW